MVCLSGKVYKDLASVIILPKFKVLKGTVRKLLEEEFFDGDYTSITINKYTDEDFLGT